MYLTPTALCLPMPNYMPLYVVVVSRWAGLYEHLALAEVKKFRPAPGPSPLKEWILWCARMLDS